MISLRRRRNEIIEHAAAYLKGANDSKLTDLIRDYCRNHGIPATRTDIQDMANEAIRRRLVEKIKELIARIAVLEGERQTIIDKFAQIDARLDQAQTAFINLRDKVNSYHP